MPQNKPKVDVVHAKAAAIMPAEPSDADPPKRKRRFQFSLRTLMIGVTLLAVPSAYVGWQAKIVRDRKAVARWIEERKGELSGTVTTPPDEPYRPQVSWIRRVLGDKGVALISLPKPVSDDDRQRIKSAFPEADIIVGTPMYPPGIVPTPQYPATQP